MANVRMGDKCRISGMAPELVLAVIIVSHFYDGLGEELVIFHVTDGLHMVGSLHYVGHALDISQPGNDVAVIVHDLKRMLGQDFDVVNERTHIHIEYQPKVAINSERG